MTTRQGYAIILRSAVKLMPEYNITRGHSIGKPTNVEYLERTCSACGDKKWIKSPGGEIKMTEVANRRCVPCYRRFINPWVTQETREGRNKFKTRRRGW